MGLEEKEVDVLNKKDLQYSWFSGTGAGGQHRNKHMNCLRLKHVPSGIQVVGQNNRDRISNEREALEKLTERVRSFYHPVVQKERFRAKENIRSYREPDNIVVDHASGEVFSYKKIVLDANPNELEKVITARRSAITERGS
jgi:protein subunit release factor A